jgi:hypothetical protein
MINGGGRGIPTLRSTYTSDRSSLGLILLPRVDTGVASYLLANILEVEQAALAVKKSGEQILVSTM